MTDYRIWPSTPGSSEVQIDRESVNLAVEFHVTQTSWLKGFRFYNPAMTPGSSSTMARVGGLFRVAGTGTSDQDGTLLGQATFATNPTPDAWNEAFVATPIQLAANTPYRAVILHPKDSVTNNAGYAANGNYFRADLGAQDIVHGPLVAPNDANATGGRQGSYAYASTLAFTYNYFNGANYWADVIVTDVDPAASPPARLWDGTSEVLGSWSLWDGASESPLAQSLWDGTKES